MIKTCKHCKQTFNSRLSRYQFCSVLCSGKYRSGDKNPQWVGGRPKKKCKNCGDEFFGYTYRISVYCSRQCCGKAKIIGGEAGINSIHSWIRRRKPEPSACETCGESGVKLDLANINHKYSRNLADYRYWCRSCHRKFDIAHNGYTKVGYYSRV